jgi:micrococcal nuclease
MIKPIWLITAVLLLLVSQVAFAKDFACPVFSLLDGDTIEVLNGHHADRIRLSGIDCPEKGQAW